MWSEDTYFIFSLMLVGVYISSGDFLYLKNSTYVKGWQLSLNLTPISPDPKQKL